MNSFSNGVYIALDGLDLQGTNVKLPSEMELRETYVHISTPMILDYKRTDEELPRLLPTGGERYEVKAELFVPGSAESTLDEQMEMASTVIFLLRMYFDPSVSMLALSNLSFSEIYDSKSSYHIIPIQRLRRTFGLCVVETEKRTITKVAEVFNTAHKLRTNSTEFRVAANAFDSFAFLEDSALMLIQMWGALEAMFSPSTSELRFRVSALLASFLYPPGSERLAQQKRIASLYDKRSAAAHGKPKHVGDDVFNTFNILRQVLAHCIHEGQVPSKEDLEKRLFASA